MTHQVPLFMLHVITSKGQANTEKEDKLIIWSVFLVLQAYLLEYTENPLQRSLNPEAAFSPVFKLGS